MALEDKLVRASGVKSVWRSIQDRIAAIKEAMVEHPHSKNLLNPAEFEAGKQIGASGEIETYTGRTVSGYIPVKKGDVVYLSGIDKTGALLPVSGSGSGNILRLVTYTEDKIKIDKGTNKYPTWTNSYVIPDDTAAFIRICMQTTAASTLGQAQLITLTINEAPASVEDVDAYSELYYDAIDAEARADIDELQNDLAMAVSRERVVVPNPEVAGWGDSRIANGGTTTSVVAYLAGLMGSGVGKYNFGKNGQGSGETALAMDAVEVYVRAANDQLTDGDNTLSICRINRGTVQKNLMQWIDSADGGVSCSICGISGKLWNYLGNGVKFTPSSTLSSPVSVPPMTRVFVAPSNHYRTTVIWSGKNDFYRASETGFSTYLADVVSAMAEKIPHNRFVILGETASSSDAYKTGGETRAVMDAYNTMMKQRYPENFINIQDELSSRGLAMAGIQPTEADTQALADGLLPPSLMSDDVHPNPTCRQVIAQIIYEHLQARGWV